MLIAGIAIVAFIGMANIWYYDHKVVKPKPKTLDFTGFKFKDKK